MWVMLSDSFLSIVADRDSAHLLMVRARVEGDIERVFPGAEVTRTPDGDYLYRTRIRRSEVAQAIADQLSGIQYDNFKNSVADDQRHDAYLSCWSAMNRLQQQKSKYRTKR